LLPHNWNPAILKAEYVKEIEDISLNSKKKILVFFYGDSNKKVYLKNSIIFRTSVYRSFVSKNEIVMPAYAEDLGKNNFYVLKKESIPSVGFVGRSKFKNLYDRFKSSIKGFLKKDFERDGRFFREKAIEILKHSNLVKANFVERSYYSAHLKTVEGSPMLLREEFISNLKNNHFALAPKGDGNYSLRFFEALSLGRIPVVIDTDMILPLEDEIDYSKVAVICPMNEIGKIDFVIRKFFDNLKDDAFIEAQKNARLLFEKFLYAPRFLKFVMRKDYLDKFSD
jgi:hypothetical protein